MRWNSSLTSYMYMDNIHTIMKTIIKKRKQLLEKELQRILTTLEDNYSPEKIILFGSLANNMIHEWSDIDLVIIKETDNRFLDRLHEVRLLTVPKVGVNFIIYTPSEINNMIKDGNYFLLHEILMKGKTLYEKDQQLVSFC